MTFDEYPHASFIRIVVNLSDRENKTVEKVVSWRKIVFDDIVTNGTTNGFAEEAFATPPTNAQVKEHGIVTFGQYRYQSVGLDGIYQMNDYNTTNSLLWLDKAYEDVSGQTTN